MEYIRAKPTIYNKTYFHSRLKARWALFFDLIHIKWVYKPEGQFFPDFWLPQVEMYAHVRPTEFTMQDFADAYKLRNEGKYFSTLMLVGSYPKYRPYYALDYYEDEGIKQSDYPYALSSQGGYPQNEHRFWFCLNDTLDKEGGFEDTKRAISIVRIYDFDGQSIYR